MSTLYLHIGQPKTGTTTIQNFLWDNQEALNARGICFPDMGYRYPDIDYHRNGHFLIRQRPAEGEEISHLKEGFAKLRELSRQYDSIILSEEGIWASAVRMTKFWKRLTKELEESHMDLRVIVYLRRQDLWVQSFWAQKVKVGKTALDFPSYLQFLKDLPYPMDYCAYMDRLAGLFGKEALIIRVMEGKQFKGAEHSLVSDFLDIFGLSLSDGFVEQQEMRNPKFSGPYLEIKRTLNTLPWFQDTRTNSFAGAILKVQEENPLRHNLKGCSFFAPGAQKPFRDSFAESNSRLAREYLGREDGVLFLESENDLPPMTINDKDMINDTILVCGTILQNMKEQNAEQKKTIRALQKREEALSREVESLSQEMKKLKKSMEANSFKGKLRRVKNRLKPSQHSS